MEKLYYDYDKESGEGYKSVSLRHQNSDPSQDALNWFQIAHFNPMMHSFLMMYNTMGSKVDGLAVREHFLSKIA